MPRGRRRAPFAGGFEGVADPRLAAWLSALAGDEDLAGALRHHEMLPARPACLADLDLSPALQRVLRARGIHALYAHQARALALLRQDHDVVLATPTASGKSLVYNLPALGAVQADPEARALYLFPLKALEQDQRKALERDAAALGTQPAPRVAIYDGDTPPSRRKRLREDPPHVLITTPDMLHLGILPHHASWARFFRGLRLVAVDELHTYRGVFGSHVAQVLRRLLRVARHHGARPRLVCASATVANPGELASHLTGRTFRVVESDGAARPRRHVLLVNPHGSPYTAASKLFRLAVGAGLRTIAFTKARRVTELMHAWVCQAEPQLASRVSSYRAGFLPEERREIERRLFAGELLGVISTSALELGIDVGGLDVCLLVGYPGSQVATWQRAGRVGRAREGVVVLVAQPDALDQYLVAHPEFFFQRHFEPAVVDPGNADVLAAHLPCAAAEVPLRPGEPWLAEPDVGRAVAALEERGALLRSEAGHALFAARARPHREVSLRAAGTTYAIQLREPGAARPRALGSIGSAHVLAECHPGAIYLHHGRSYRVADLDLDARTVRVEPVDVPYYTRALSEKETEILSRDREREAAGFRLAQGRVRVTTRFTGFERRRVRGQELLGTEPLSLPPTSFETISVWLEIPAALVEGLGADGGSPMGGLHAVEHAALALFPLFALCDRFDVAGISSTRHPQLGGPSIFFYDAHPGGVGLAPTVFDRMEALLEATSSCIAECDCEQGCPACVHSPRCGNGNRPIDKAAALRALAWLLGHAPLPAARAASRVGACDVAVAPRLEPEQPATPPWEPDPHVVLFDLETQRSAAEVGGWHNAHLMRLALAVVYDRREARFETYREADVEALVAKLESADLVVGFNVLRFDYRVLRGYVDRDLAALPTFDLLDAIHRRVGFRLSLGHLGEETLGAPKSGDGLASLRWWREGRLDEIERYCRDDVTLLRDLFEHARSHGHLLFRTRRGERVRLPLHVSLPELVERGLAARRAVQAP